MATAQTFLDCPEHGHMKTILWEKRLRRIAEEDALRLYNRVRQLNKEEEKAGKRIEDTRRKANEIVRLRDRNEKKLEEKEQRLIQLQLEIERQKLENQKLKEEIAKNKFENESKIYADKLTMAQQAKEERLEVERMIIENKVQARKKNVELKELVKKAQQEAEVKLAVYKTFKLQQAQDDYERRLQEEIEERKRKEKEIEKLAKTEIELIEKLKHKQLEQKKAYEQLEAALALSSTRCSTKRTPSTTSRPATQETEKPQPQEPTDEDIARAFAYYDQDAAGEISTLQLEGLMADLGSSLNAVQLSHAITQLDTRQIGRIAFGEFLLWWKG